MDRTCRRSEDADNRGKHLADTADVEDAANTEDGADVGDAAGARRSYANECGWATTTVADARARRIMG